MKDKSRNLTNEVQHALNLAARNALRLRLRALLAPPHKYGYPVHWRESSAVGFAADPQLRCGNQLQYRILSFLGEHNMRTRGQ